MLTYLDWHLYLCCSGCMPLAVGCYTAHPRRDDSASHSYWHFLHACMQREPEIERELDRLRYPLLVQQVLHPSPWQNDIASQRTDQNNDEKKVPSAEWCIMQCNAMQAAKGRQKSRSVHYKLAQQHHHASDVLISDLNTSWERILAEHIHLNIHDPRSNH